MSSINLAWEFLLAGAATTCLSLVKLSGLKVEQLLKKIRTAIAGKICLTITSFFRMISWAFKTSSLFINRYKRLTGSDIPLFGVRAKIEVNARKKHFL